MKELFLTQRMVGAGRPLVPQIWAILTLFEQNCRFPISLDEQHALHLSPQRGTQKCKMDVFSQKVHFSQSNSITKFIWMKTFRDRVVRHLLAYLNVQKWLVGNISVKVNIFFLKRTTR